MSFPPRIRMMGIRMADKKIGAGTRLGSVGNLADARRVVELVDQVHDPFARCSFRCNYAYALDLSSFYNDAHEQALLVLADAADFRVDPALQRDVVLDLGHNDEGKQHGRG